jgi:hypothetical protein
LENKYRTRISRGKIAFNLVHFSTKILLPLCNIFCYYLPLFVKKFVIDWQTDNIMLKRSAVKKESTLKPTTILSHKTMISALTISRKSPNVKMVAGKVKNTKMGFTKIFKIPKTMATMIEVMKLSTVMPVMKCAMINTKIAVIKSRVIVFMIKILIKNTLKFYNIPKINLHLCYYINL